MAKPAKKTSRRARKDQFDELTTVRDPIRKKSAQLRAKEVWERRESKPVQFLNENQRHYWSAMQTAALTIALGPAGVGKTWLSMRHAIDQLESRRIEKIVVVRPIIESGGGLGFLPGDEAEKCAPYKVPFIEVLEEYYGKSHAENLMSGPHPRVIFVPPEFLRGRTFKDALVILDEAQNMTCDQMKTFLTRIGEDTRCVIQGDVEQVDIKGKSGLVDAMELLEGLDGIQTVSFTEEDIVRSGLVKAILMRYRARHRLLNESP